MLAPSTLTLAVMPLAAFWALGPGPLSVPTDNRKSHEPCQPGLFDDFAIDSIEPSALSKGGPHIEGRRGVQHKELPIVEFGSEKFDASGHRATLLLPPSFFFPVVLEDDVDEPVFDPAVHLSLRDPASVALLPEFEPVPPADVPPVDTAAGSRLAYTAPFDMLSEEGVAVAHRILLREKVHAHRNHRNIELRGLHYRSPWMRALMNDPTLLAHFGRMAGEPVVPHMLLMGAPSANFGAAGAAPVVGATVDPWHFDSLAYVGVALISDVESMLGGELQLVKRSSKDEAIDLIEATLRRPPYILRITVSATHGHSPCYLWSQATLNRPPEEAITTVNYERAGRCIFVQGSEVEREIDRYR